MNIFNELWALIMVFSAGMLIILIITTYILSYCIFRKNIRVYDTLVKLYPNVDEVYYKRGSILAEFGYKEQALEDFDKVIQLNPMYAKAYFARGVIKGFLGDFKSAEKDLETALKLDKSLDSNIKPYLRDARKETGTPSPETKEEILEDNLQDAVEETESRSSEIENKAEKGKIGVEHYQKAKQYAIFGNFEMARKYYNKALNTQVEQKYVAEIFKERGIVKEKLQDFEGAIEDWGRAIELKPSYKTELQPKIDDAQRVKGK